MDARNTAAFETAVLFVAGCFQRRGTETNGVHDAFRRVYARHAGPETLIEYYRWLDNVPDIAAHLEKLNADALQRRGKRLQIVLVGYSFGGGTVANLANELRIRGIDVDLVILCDPVRRLWDRFGWIGALLPLRIRLRGNVKRPIWFRQANPWLRPTWPFFFPSSHRVTAANLVRVLPFDDEHSVIDENTTFQATIDYHVAQITESES